MRFFLSLFLRESADCHSTKLVVAYLRTQDYRYVGVGARGIILIILTIRELEDIAESSTFLDWRLSGLGLGSVELMIDQVRH